MNATPRFLNGSFLFLAGLNLAPEPSFAQPVYEFGNPSAEEQLYIESVNRARANPAAEGTRLANTTDQDVIIAMSYFSVDRAMLESEMAAIPASQPLAPSAQLAQAARSHSTWMLANATQSHTQTDFPSTIAQRIAATGYDAALQSENIFAYAKNVYYGHASFEIDWGPGGTGGMLAGRGHRESIHLIGFREIGIGNISGTNGAVGPQVVTQVFGRRNESRWFASGVAYFDLDGDDFYDIGEGIPGLKVTLTDATQSCITATGGGWAIPLPASTVAVDRTVTFSGGGLTQSITLAAHPSGNAKADLKLTYTPPLIKSPPNAWLENPFKFIFGATPGATSYRWTRWNVGAAATENCDDKSNATFSLSGTQSGLNTQVKFEGSAAFQLANPGKPEPQSIELTPLFLGGSSPSMKFQSRIAYATAAMVHKVQFKEDGKTIWQDAYAQAGRGSAAESGFTQREVPFSGMAGKAFKVRFLASLTPGGSTYSDTGTQYGWMIDAISFTDVSGLSGAAVQSLPGPIGSFTPPALGKIFMAVAPEILGSTFPASHQVLHIIPPPAPSFTTWARHLENSNGLADGTFSNFPNGDYDHDGIQNLIEYAFGGAPQLANVPSAAMPVLQPSETHFILRYQRDTTLTDVTVTPLMTTDLITWSRPGQAGAAAEFTDEMVSTSGSIQIREARLPKGAARSGCFMSIQVRRP